MNLLANTRVYLAGAVEHDPNCKSWREEVTEKLKPYKVHVFDPMVKPKWLPEICKKDPKIYIPAISGNSTELTKEQAYEANRHVRRLCLAHVSAADWLICYMPKKFTAGTFEEIYLACQLNKPVFFVVPDGIPSTWMAPQFAEHNEYDKQENVFFYNWPSMLAHIESINNGTIDVDPYKWIFKRYENGVWANKTEKDFSATMNIWLASLNTELSQLDRGYSIEGDKIIGKHYLTEESHVLATIDVSNKIVVAKNVHGDVNLAIADNYFFDKLKAALLDANLWVSLSSKVGI